MVNGIFFLICLSLAISVAIVLKWCRKERVDFSYTPGPHVSFCPMFVHPFWVIGLELHLFFETHFCPNFNFSVHLSIFFDKVSESGRFFSTAKPKIKPYNQAPEPHPKHPKHPQTPQTPWTMSPETPPLGVSTGLTAEQCYFVFAPRRSWHSGSSVVGVRARE